eukprot:225480-Chlamydomonas_euryale.AAC.1
MGSPERPIKLLYLACAGTLCVPARCTGMSANLLNQVTRRLRSPGFDRASALRPALFSAGQQH